MNDAEDLSEVITMAAKEFEPWDRSDCPLPTNEQWIESVNPDLVSLRMAFAINCLTKTEVVKAVDGMNQETFEKIFDSIVDVERLMDGYRMVAAAASARLLVGCAVLTVREAA